MWKPNFTMVFWLHVRRCLKYNTKISAWMTKWCFHEAVWANIGTLSLQYYYKWCHTRLDKDIFDSQKFSWVFLVHGNRSSGHGLLTGLAPKSAI